MKNIVIEGIYSHFADSNEISIEGRTKKQIDIFLKAVGKFKKNGFKNIVPHISATSGIFVCEEKLKSKLVRVGIGLYGMWPSYKLKEKFGNKVGIEPVIRWVSHIAQIKILPKNFDIGYGSTYKTGKKMKVAIVPQGFCSGYDRGLSNYGEILINGERCKILGTVSMNMLTVDVSHLTDVKTEDEVVLLGRQGNEMITAEEIAEKINTINEEITTRISRLMPRVIVQ